MRICAAFVGAIWRDSTDALERAQTQQSERRGNREERGALDPQAGGLNQTFEVSPGVAPQVPQIGVTARPQPLVRWYDQDEHSAGGENARRFAQRGGVVGDVFQHVHAQNRIEAFGGKGQQASRRLGKARSFEERSGWPGMPRDLVIHAQSNAGGGEPRQKRPVHGAHVQHTAGAARQGLRPPGDAPTHAAIAPTSSRR